MQRFRSRIDPWLGVLILLAIAGEVAALVAVLSSDLPTGTAAGVTVLVVLSIGLTVSIVARTHYSVGDGRLAIVCGPFSWSIDLDDIAGVGRSRNPLSSPALSLDRLKIRYGDGKSILISPDDQDAFLRAIGQAPERHP